MQKILDNVKDHIEKVGVSIIHVGAGEHSTAQFTYTVGFTSIGLPEMVIMGLSYHIGHRILMDLYAKAKAEGLPEDGVDLNEILDRYPVRLKTIPKATAEKFAAVAMRFFQKKIGVRQVVWPDPEGRFPGDLDMDMQMAAIQDMEFQKLLSDCEES